jgi:hypothetical protein
MGREETCTGFFDGDTWRKEATGGGASGVDGRIILRWIFRKWDVAVGWLRTQIGGGHL